MTFKIYTDEDIVIELDPELIQVKIHLLEEKFDDIVRFQEKNVLIDMGNISFLDSLLLSVLIRFRSRLYVTGRTLQLINCNERIVDSIRRAALEDYLLN